MKLDKKLFGRKVLCKGYLKEVKTKYVYANEEHFRKIVSDPIDECLRKDMLSLEDEMFIRQKTKEVYKQSFTGVIVGAKEITTENVYEQASEAIYDPDSLGYVDERYLDAVRVYGDKPVKCYVIFYANNKSRLVPINLVEV